jgi:catechol 2,3-dioxygenase-like lactoylglutathione lyase family enzyme
MPDSAHYVRVVNRPVTFCLMRDYETNRPSSIESIGAVTLTTHDMARSVYFYTSLGFQLLYGGGNATFSSFTIGDGYLNLTTRPTEQKWSGWGRLIFHVSDVDALYHKAVELGLSPEAPPRDAEWGERYFHLADPNGHQLSFARPLTPR